MKKTIFVVSSALGLLLASGCAYMPELSKSSNQTSAQAETQGTRSAATQMEARDRITATAIVQKVDSDARELVVRGSGGKLYTLQVGDDVRNLSQVKAGDRVELSYYEALALNIENNAKKVAPSRRELAAADRAASGQQREIEMIADVTKVNKKTRRMTLQGAQDAVTLKVPTDLDIRKIKVGNQVKAHYVQELAVAIKTAADKKKPK